MNESVIAILSLGFIYGLRHALDADHLVAVSTIVSEHKSLWRSSLIGTFWGLGHTASLLGVGIVVLLLKISIPKHIEPWMEMPVALMLIALGGLAVWQAFRNQAVSIHSHIHEHNSEGEHSHVHIHLQNQHNHQHHLIRIGRKPFLVGMVHGFAGSAALMLIALTTVPTVALGLAYIAIFGIGSVGGMLLMSAMIGLPFVATAEKFASFNRAIRIVAGLFSIGFGLYLAWNLLHEIFTLSS
ncbi:MAG: urease accessory protein UreH [Acidobacteriota bacterium]